ncbi:MAG: hypothetical protein D6675_14455 [Gemmatimonadetes bacterium]|nr:MAG: hypothetical protein D6675_14455 [Gemmatimonadota bacterium]
MPNHHLWIESILENEALTDGLTDTDAQILIDWVISRLKTAHSETEADHCRHQMRYLSKATQAIWGKSSEKKCRFYLGKLFPEARLSEIQTATTTLATPTDVLTYLLNHLDEA